MLYKRKICVITGSRAEYGLLYQLIKKLKKSKKITTQIIVTGSHLSKDHGETYKTIQEDGFVIDEKIEVLQSSDNELGITKSIGAGVIGFAESFSSLQPDIVVVLGDRYEIFSAVVAAMIANIPVAHMHGGEKTEGAFDEAIRHSITKMSHLHFTASVEYRNRVIQLGEQPSSVFNVGAIGVENINKMKLLSKDEFENSIQFKLGVKNILVTYHPVTLESSTSKEQFGNLLTVLEQLQDTKIIFTKANADVDGMMINKMIDKYVSNHNKTSIAFSSLGQLRYLSALQYVSGVVGNSSSGLLEVPYFNIGTVNIGDRQKGRVRVGSVIDCDPTKISIKKAIDRLINKEFSQSRGQIIQLFGNGTTADKVCEILESVSLDGILKKHFHDIPIQQNSDF
jgi:GDP/UDP-N,N'-diacetylbacillosamine 2-epimerase (hydrolysing)